MCEKQKKVSAARARWRTERRPWDEDRCSRNARPLLNPVTPSPPSHLHRALPQSLPLKQPEDRAFLPHILAWVPCIQTLSTNKSRPHSTCHSHQSFQCAQVLPKLAFSGFPRPAAWPRSGSGLCPEMGHFQPFYPL